jgi:FkbM family methyltransferase
MLERAILHNHVEATRGPKLIRAKTPEEKWSYAVEVPLDSDGYDPIGPLRAKLRVDVDSGSVGVGCISSLNEMIAEKCVEPPGAEVEILIPAGIRVRSLILRNASERGSSVFSARDLALAAHEKAPTQEVVVDIAALGQFKPWSGRVQAGYFMNWLGVKTRVHVWDFSPEHAAAFAVDRDESTAAPTEDEHLLDYAPLLDALVAAPDQFVMVALGCGWGRWLSAGAFAAKQTGRDYRLFGVEAEPVHFGWLREHFEDNAIDDSRATLMRAAASHKNGRAWFQIGDSAAWYGQSIKADDEVPDGVVDGGLWSETQVDGIRMQRVESIDLRTIAEQLPLIDYVHMDIQGSEADFLEAHPAVLDRRVRFVNVGTHSSVIEDRLRVLFQGLGWECRYDIPLQTAALMRSGPGAEPIRVDFGDGVQVWRNPRLTNDR